MTSDEHFDGADRSTGDHDEDPSALDPLPREPFSALASWCVRRNGAHCERCERACPQGAISLDQDGPSIERALCTDCGICAGVCDAFAWPVSTLSDLVETAKRVSAKDGMACFTCNDFLIPGAETRSNVIVLPCLASVPPEFWSALLAHDVNVGIYREADYCSSCFIGGPNAPLLFSHALTTAESWTGRTAVALGSVPLRENLLDFCIGLDGEDRRGIFSKLADEGKDIASGKHRKEQAGTVQSFHEKNARLRAKARIGNASIPPFGPDHRTRPRQDLIVEAANALPERAAELTRYTATTDKQRCSGAGSCIDACPTGARSIDEDGTAIVNPSLCIACGACIEACEREANGFAEITARAYLDSITDQ